MSSPRSAGATADGTLDVKLVQGIEELDAASWDACVGPDQPFLSHAFLATLEASGSACRETGWLPRGPTARPDSCMSYGAANAWPAPGIIWRRPS